MANEDYRKIGHAKRRPAGLPEQWACKKCEKLFRPIRFNNIYCSQSCRHSESLKKYRERWGHDGPTDFVPGKELKCAYCEKPFIQDRSGKRCCSKSCAVLYGTKEWRKRNPNFDSDRHNTIRQETLGYYSNGKLECVCCGENEMKFLTIDHIHGGGKKQTDSLNRKGVTFYLWLIKQGFPEGYQTLCMNCNYAKGHWGSCPHQKSHP